MANGGGELELSIVDQPRSALELCARSGGAAIGKLPVELRAARRYANELGLAWHAGVGAVITARRWLRGNS